jgi:hypothetical protein
MMLEPQYASLVGYLATKYVAKVKNKKVLFLYILFNLVMYYYEMNIYMLTVNHFIIILRIHYTGFTKTYCEMINYLSIKVMTSYSFCSLLVYLIASAFVFTDKKTRSIINHSVIVTKIYVLLSGS